IGLMFALTLVANWCVVAADDLPKELTQEERKELEAKWNELTNAGVTHLEAGKLAEATEALEKGLAAARRLHPKQDHPNVANSLHYLAVVLIARAKYTDAEPLCREALEMNRRLYPKQDHPDLALSLNLLAAVLQ